MCKKLLKKTKGGGALRKITGIVVFVMVFYISCGTGMAGDLNPAVSPSDPDSAMYILDDFYNRLLSGTVAEKRTGGFTEPENVPGDTGRTLNEIMAKMPLPDNVDGAISGDVVEGKTFFSLRTDGVWGLNTGTLADNADKVEYIKNQDEFDSLFNKGEPTVISANTTIIIFPLKDENTGEILSYVLKNIVRLNSDTSITGFNPKTTKVIKETAHCRFELIGTFDEPVSGVIFSGWTFNGNDLELNANGGALYLKYVNDCEFNCYLVNHAAVGNGGAIYGENSSGIEAKYIDHCKTIGNSAGSEDEKTKGGAVYGVSNAIINARYCSAIYGGAVAECDDSIVIAKNCTATIGGGAASRCERLRLTASSCDGGQKGGGAYYCSSLMAEGFWKVNTADEGPNIYATNNLTGTDAESHYWKGDYVGMRLDSNDRVWRVDNE